MKLLKLKVSIKKEKIENGCEYAMGRRAFDRTQCQTFTQGLTTFYGKESHDLTMCHLSAQLLWKAGSYALYIFGMATIFSPLAHCKQEPRVKWKLGECI